MQIIRNTHIYNIADTMFCGNFKNTGEAKQYLCSYKMMHVPTVTGLTSAKYRNYKKYGGNGLSLTSIYIVSVANRLDLA